MSQSTGASAPLRIALVLATLVVLAAIGWGVSVGVEVFTAKQKAAEIEAQAKPAETPAPPTEPKPEPSTSPVTQIANPPVSDETKRIQAEIDARFEEQKAKLEKELDDAAREMDDPPTRVGGDVTRPEKISGGDPSYTEAARRARIQGVVILETVIDREGRVTRTHVLKPLPMGLDQKAQEAVAKWRFKPALRAGEPVSVLYTVTVDFRLE